LLPGDIDGKLKLILDCLVGWLVSGFGLLTFYLNTAGVLDFIFCDKFDLYEKEIDYP